MDKLLETLLQAKEERSEENSRKFVEVCYESLFEKMYIRAWTITGSREKGMDLIQSFFEEKMLLKVDSYLEKLPDDDLLHLENFILRMLVNFNRGLYRKNKKKRRVTTLLDEVGWQTLKIKSNLDEENDLLKKVIPLIYDLPESQCQVVLLKLQGYTNEDIGDIMGGRTVASVKNLYYRAVKNLKGCIKNEDKDELLDQAA